MAWLERASGRAGALCAEVQRQGREAGRGPYPDPRQDRKYAATLARGYQRQVKVVVPHDRSVVVALQKYYEHLSSLKELAARVSYSNKQYEALHRLQEAYVSIVEADCQKLQPSQNA
jgi:hypothetical protein